MSRLRIVLISASVVPTFTSRNAACLTYWQVWVCAAQALSQSRTALWVARLRTKYLLAEAMRQDAAASQSNCASGCAAIMRCTSLPVICQDQLLVQHNLTKKSNYVTLVTTIPGRQWLFPNGAALLQWWPHRWSQLHSFMNNREGQCSKLV